MAAVSQWAFLGELLGQKGEGGLEEKDRDKGDFSASVMP